MPCLLLLAFLSVIFVVVVCLGVAMSSAACAAWGQDANFAFVRLDVVRVVLVQYFIEEVSSCFR